MSRVLIYIITTIILIACGDIADNKVILSERYFVDAIDDDKNRSLYYSLNDGSGIGRVNNGVVAVGLDEKHIIIKQQIDNAYSYYILDIQKDSEAAKPEDSVSGPFNKSQFTDARNRLNVKNALTFSHTF